MRCGIDRLIDRIAQLQPTGVKRARYEFFFNAVDPFTHSMTLYVLAFQLNGSEDQVAAIEAALKSGSIEVRRMAAVVGWSAAFFV